MLPTKKLATIIEKRRYPRIDTKNTVDYFVYNEKKIKISHGKGHTVNLSQTGTLLQTKKKINSKALLPKIIAKEILNGKDTANKKIINWSNKIKTINFLFIGTASL